MSKESMLAIAMLVLGSTTSACGEGSGDGKGGAAGAASGGGGSGGGSGGTGGAAGAPSCAATAQSCVSLPCCSGLTCCGPPVVQPDSSPSGTCYLGCPVSDRNLKRDFAPVDSSIILEKVVSLPLSTWSYKAESTGIRHIGPMAQDFHAAFEVGPSDRTILQVDGDGVALAAIQALYARLERAEKRNVELERRLARLEARR